MKRILHFLKSTIELLRMLPWKARVLIYLQMITCGWVFAFADVIQPGLYSLLFSAIEDSNMSDLMSSGAICVCIVLFMLLIQYLNDVILDANVFGSINNMSIEAFERYHRIPYYQTNHMDDGDIYNRIHNGCNQAVSVGLVSIMMLAEFVSIGILLVSTARISLEFAGVAIVLAIVALMRTKIRVKQLESYSQRKELIVGKMEENRYLVTTDIEDAVINGNEKSLLERYQKQRDIYWYEKMKDVRNENVVYAFFETVDSVIRCLAPIALLVGSGVSCLTYGIATAALALLDSLRDSITSFAERSEGAAKAFVPIERLCELLYYPDRFENSIDELKEPSICIKNLGVAYGEHQIIHDISADIPFGQKVAIIGKNGCGKSTLLRSIMGYHNPISGTVTVGNVDVVSISHDVRRLLFSYAPANPQMFSESVFDNISMGANEFNIDNVTNAAKKARIQKNLLKYDGDKLSGGQEMRTNLARAFIHPAPIFIFDEPTYSIGADNKMHIMEGILSLPSTTIVTTHDPELLPLFDRIILLENGRTIYDGVYASLVEIPAYHEWIGTIHETSRGAEFDEK